MKTRIDKGDKHRKELSKIAQEKRVIALKAARDERLQELKKETNSYFKRFSD